MSLRQKKSIGVRSNSRERKCKKKYIFVFEGEKTEKQYFEGIYNYKDDLGIDSLIDIEILERYDETMSNQLSVVKSLDDYIKQTLLMQKNQKIIKEEIITIINSSDIEEYGIKDKILKLLNEYIVDNNYEKNIYNFINAVNNIILDSEQNIDILIDDIKALKERLEYDHQIDEVCIIIDRDKGSFKQSQYNEVVTICKENNYNLGISNPCFEFWLLLHLSNCKEYDIEDIGINRKVSKSKRFLERKLADKLNGSYNKSNIKFEQFKDNINTAIENEKLYELDIKKLESNVGTRVGLIIENMMQHNF